ncbi:MAG: AGE family epimerase/isomerase [Paracoccaceae bacterium]
MTPPPAPAGLSAEGWALWFRDVFVPGWLARVAHPAGGVCDHLGADGRPDTGAPQTVLALSRSLFTLSHLAQLSGDAALTAGAGRLAAALPRYRKAPGLYRQAVDGDAAAAPDPALEVARSYDQSFVLLALATWNRLQPGQEQEIEAIWAALTRPLCDPATGLLRNDDSAAPAPDPAQNPHMHLYEACLQAAEMSGSALWLDRAAGIRARALRHFLDPETGSIAEFLAPDLSPLPGPQGARREPGHQYEWAWLLRREVELGGDPAVGGVAARLMDFAGRHGHAQSGPMRGAVFDAVAPDGGVIEDSFLLWPQTEAIKALAQSHIAGATGAGDRARSLLVLMFERWFAGRPAHVNRLDARGGCLWPQALTRLFYHLALALSEGGRAGLWPCFPRRHDDHPSRYHPT